MQKVSILIILVLACFSTAMAQSKKKFPDALDTAVFTTKYVTEDNSVITYVSHDDEDGAWQFLSDDEISEAEFEKVAKVASLENIIKLDPTVLELADMPVGHYATRKNKKDKWKIIKE